MKQIELFFNIVLKRLFLFYIFICSFLPSGTIFHFNIKMFLFIIILIFFFPIFFITKMAKVNYIIILFSLSLLFFYMLLGLINGYYFLSVLVEFKFIIVIYLTLIIAYVIYLNTNDKLEFLKDLLIYSIYGSLSFLVAKAYFFIAMLLGVYDYSYIKNVIYPAINYEPVGLTIAIGGSRFSFINLDFLSISLFILYLYFKKNILYLKLPISIEIIYAISLIVSIFSAYSRLLFIVFPILLLITFVLNKDYKKIFIFFIAISFLVLYFYQDILLIIEQRFFHQEHSDIWRKIMINVLIDSWAESPILGKGIGAYSHDLIRDPKMLFSYEVQFLSLLMQFGVFFILTNVILLYLFLRKIFHKTVFLIFIIFISLVIASMTNQYLLSSTMSVLYVLIFIIMLIENDRNFILKRKLC